MAEAKKFIDVNLAEEVKEFISVNSDVECKKELKDKIFSFDDLELIKVTKEIGSSTKILGADILTEELLAKEL